MIGWIVGGVAVGIIGLGIYSIMDTCSKNSREEEKTVGDYELNYVDDYEYCSLGWAINKWEKYKISTVINNGGI